MGAYELEQQGPDKTLVTETYGWGDVTDMKLKARFQMVPEKALQDSLAKLASQF